MEAHLCRGVSLATRKASSDPLRLDQLRRAGSKDQPSLLASHAGYVIWPRLDVAPRRGWAGPELSRFSIALCGLVRLRRRRRTEEPARRPGAVGLILHDVGPAHLACRSGSRVDGGARTKFCR
jgi:hypothetical protein